MEEPVVPKREPILDLLAPISKFSATLILVIYILGFLVTALHYSTFGIPQSNPFKMQVVAAGVWAILLLGTPVVFAHRTRPSARALDPLVRSLAYNLFLLYFFVGILSNGLEFEADRRYSLEALPVGLLASLLLLKIASKVPRRAALLRWGALCLIAGAIIYCGSAPRTAGSTIVWLFIWGGMGCLVIDSLKEGLMRIEYYFLMMASISLSAITALAINVYPRVEYSWGGGKPIPALICFSKQSEILPGQQVRASLLEQSDGGYYVLEEANHKALFVPNASVSWVYYGKKGFDPKSIAR